MIELSNQDLPEAFQRVTRTIVEARLDDYDPLFYRYYEQHLENASHVRRYLRYQLDHLELAGADPRGKSVLDVGCGFGMALVVCGLLGADRLRGIDSHDGKIRTVRAYRPLLPGPLRSVLEPRVGDAADLPYDDGEFDLLLSIEAISHYLDVDHFIAEAARVLRPGGLLIISDGNNGSNPLVTRKTHQIWRAFEEGPDGTMIHGHTISDSYRTQRRRLLAARFAELDSADIQRLATLTAGLLEDDVVVAGRTFLQTGELPANQRGPNEVPVSPGGQVIERLFEPFKLASQLREHGFETSVFGYWGGASGRRRLRSVNRSLSRSSRWTIATAPAFRIAARRRQG